MDPVLATRIVGECKLRLPHDTRPFEQLVSLYKDRVFSTAYRLMGNRQEAEDVAQEVFLKVYRNIRTLDEPATLTAWIYRITVNTCYDTLTKQRRRPATTPLTPHTSDGNEEIHYADTRTMTPEETVLQMELRRCLERTLEQLDQTSRTVLVLRDVEDRPYQEIASSLSIGLSAVKMRIHRARQAFQHALATVCPGLHNGVTGTFN